MARALILIIVSMMTRYKESKSVPESKELYFEKRWNSYETCLREEAQITKLNITSAVECAILCLNLVNGKCLRFQYRTNLEVCDIFTTWKNNFDLVNDVNCRLYQGKGTCPESFVFAPVERSCYQIASGNWNWSEARSHCNRIPGEVHLAMITSSSEKNWLDQYFSFMMVKVPKCFVISGYSYHIWLGGQRLVPENDNSEFVWKPFPNKSYPLREHFWGAGQPDKIATLESCISIWQTTEFKWNNAECKLKKCALCETTANTKDP